MGQEHLKGEQEAQRAVEALHAEVRRALERSRGIGLAVGLALGDLVLLLTPRDGVGGAFLAMVTVVAVLGLVEARARRRVDRRLAALPPERRLPVLRRLSQEEGSLHFAAMHIRELRRRLHAAVPAEAPQGRGDELAPPYDTGMTI